MTDENKRSRMKIRIIIWAAVLLILAAGAYVLLGHPDIFDKNAGTLEVTGSNGFYDYFYEADYSLKLEDYEDYNEYLGLDRALYYKKGNQTIGLSSDMISSQPDEIKFFGKYFDAIIAGDAEKYNSMHSEKYFETHEAKERFTPQMVYAMQIEYLSSDNTSGCSEYVFDVSYKIFENNGTFRDDIYSDASRTQRITIDDSDGEYKISKVQYYIAAN